jgi:hypothetical protein
MKHIPQRIGQSAVIDSTLDSFLKSITTCATRDKKDLALTYAANANALSNIRRAIITAESDSLYDEALTGIFLLILVEVPLTFIKQELEGSLLII